MLDKIKALFAVLQAGKSVSNVTAWKKGQITANLLVVLIAALAQLAKAFGYDLQLDSETIDSIAIGVLAFINWLLTLSTSEKVGFGKAPEAEPLPQIEVGQPPAPIEERTINFNKD